MRLKTMKEIILDESVADIDKWLPKEAIDETVAIIRSAEKPSKKRR